jgi:hypothetical protein
MAQMKSVSGNWQVVRDLPALRRRQRGVSLKLQECNFTAGFSTDTQAGLFSRRENSAG